jgi:hypothetical protein
MRTRTRAKELLEHERKFWNAMQEKDDRAAARMTDDNCIVVGAQGVSAIDSATMGKLTKEGDWEIERFAFDEKSAQVRFIADDVALVAYKVSEEVIVDGKTLSFDANDSSVWVKRDGAWLCAMHTESLAGDPYGRDKRAD